MASFGDDAESDMVARRQDERQARDIAAAFARPPKRTFNDFIVVSIFSGLCPDIVCQCLEEFNCWRWCQHIWSGIKFPPLLLIFPMRGLSTLVIRTLLI